MDLKGVHQVTVPCWQGYQSTSSGGLVVVVRCVWSRLCASIIAAKQQGPPAAAAHLMDFIHAYIVIVKVLTRPCPLSLSLSFPLYSRRLV